MSATEQEFIILRNRIRDLEDRLDFLYRRLGIEYGENSGAVNPRIIELIKNGKKIEAIKLYREMTNMGLAEAKQAIDQIENSIS